MALLGSERGEISSPRQPLQGALRGPGQGEGPACMAGCLSLDRCFSLGGKTYFEVPKQRTPILFSRRHCRKAVYRQSTAMLMQLRLGGENSIMYGGNRPFCGEMTDCVRLAAPRLHAAIRSLYFILRGASFTTFNFQPRPQSLYGLEVVRPCKRPQTSTLASGIHVELNSETHGRRS